MTLVELRPTKKHGVGVLRLISSSLACLPLCLLQKAKSSAADTAIVSPAGRL